MNTSILENALRQVGLSSYEAKCYLSLLERDTLTVPEVSKLARIPRPSAYDALEKLMTRGLCSSKPGETKQYSASDPALFKEKSFMEVDELTEHELQKLRNSVKEREKEIVESSNARKESISNLIDQLRPQYEKSRQEVNPLDYIEIIKDSHQIHRRFLQLVAGAQEEIVGFTKPPFSVPLDKMEEEQPPPQGERLKAGVRIRSIYEIPKDKDDRKFFFHYADSGVKAGTEVRVLEWLPMKMGVFDSRIVLFTLEDPVSKQSSLTCAVIEHRALAESLKILFETLWAQAQDYHTLKH